MPFRLFCGGVFVLESVRFEKGVIMHNVLCASALVIITMPSVFMCLMCVLAHSTYAHEQLFLFSVLWAGLFQDSGSPQA